MISETKELLPVPFGLGSSFLTESSKSPSSIAWSAKRWVGGTYLCQVEFKLHLTNRDSGYEVMSK